MRSPMPARRWAASLPRRRRSRSCCASSPRLSVCRGAAPDRGIRQQPHPGLQCRRRHDRRRRRGLSQKPIPQVQYPLGRSDARRRFRHDARGTGATLQAAVGRSAAAVFTRSRPAQVESDSGDDARVATVPPSASMTCGSCADRPIAEPPEVAKLIRRLRAYSHRPPAAGLALRFRPPSDRRSGAVRGDRRGS